MTEKKSLKSVVAKLKARLDASQKSGAEPSWIKQVAMLTGVLAALSGFLTVRSTMLTNDAIYESNQAILAQTQSSDAWSEYQADSIKAHIADTMMTASDSLASDNRAALKSESTEFRGRQPALKQTANQKAAERDRHLQDGQKRLAEKDLLGYAGFAAQVGIALASVAALVRMRMAFYAGVAAGLAGVAVAVYAMAAHYGFGL